MSVMLTRFFLLAIHAVSSVFGYELPACEYPNQLAQRNAFTICFNPGAEVAAWTIHELKLGVAAGARPTHFRRDAELNSASNSDYRNSSYQRGHLVPAADLAASPEGVSDSFLLSNVAPQLPAVNLSAMRRVENAIRKLAASQSEPIVVITGTLYDCGTEIKFTGANQVAVPCAFYKVTSSNQGVKATLVGNETEPSSESVPVEVLEQRTGLRFFH